LAPGTAWTTRHLLRTGWSDIAAIAARRWRPNQAAYALRALDRFTVLAPQLDLPQQTPDLTTAALLGELRIGLNILRLRDLEAALPPPARHAVDEMLRAIAGYFGGRGRDAKLGPDDIRDPGAKAMAAAAAAMPAAEAQSAWLLLAGMQRSLLGATALPETAEAVHAR
jgi:Fusaric acid resistance protein family